MTTKISATVKFEMDFDLDPDDFPAWATAYGIEKMMEDRVSDINGLSFDKIPDLFGCHPVDVTVDSINVLVK
jgi:hypothetical protein